MEGNECYKFSTISNYFMRTGAKPLGIAVEVGVNVGEVTRLIRETFPTARIHGFEAVTEYYERARTAFKGKRGIKLYNKAVTSQHLFLDDLGERPRPEPAELRVLKGMPAAGPGWAGGATVLPADHPLVTGPHPLTGFELVDQPVRPITLDEVVATVLKTESARRIELLKLDCETCEHSTLGCAAPETLKCFQFIVGEYHGIERFYNVMERKLFQTHKVNLIGDSSLGCFFAERLEGTSDGILRYDKDGMLQPRPWLTKEPIDWHLFNEEFVQPQDRASHALPTA